MSMDDEDLTILVLEISKFKFRLEVLKQDL